MGTREPTGLIERIVRPLPGRGSRWRRRALPAGARARGVRDPLRVPRTVTVGVREVQFEPEVHPPPPPRPPRGCGHPAGAHRRAPRGPPPDELAYASALGAGRQASFAAGRVALAGGDSGGGSGAAARLSATPYFPPPTVAPACPRACWLRSATSGRWRWPWPRWPRPDGAGAALGVDLEDNRPLRVDISRRVLTEDEHRRAGRPAPLGA